MNTADVERKLVVLCRCGPARFLWLSHFVLWPIERVVFTRSVEGVKTGRSGGGRTENFVVETGLSALRVKPMEEVRFVCWVIAQTQKKAKMSPSRSPGLQTSVLVLRERIAGRCNDCQIAMSEVFV